MSTRPRLLLSRNFLPIFLAQFTGALNDNLFKSALFVIIAFTLTTTSSQATAISNLATILFILPYFFLSYIAGQFADRSNKARMIQKNKIVEIAIALVCGFAFWSESTLFLLFTLLLLGAQSAMFGPNKYALLPQLMQGRDLVQGNAYIASGTFIAILSGTLIGAFLAQAAYSWVWIEVIMLSIACAGFLAAKQIPETEIGEPELKIDWNPIAQIRKLLRIARLNRVLWLTILGVSWFWFVGTAYLTQIPALVRFIGGGDESVVVLFLVTFILGVGLGCGVSAWLSGSKPDLGIVSCALLGLCISGIDFAIIPPNDSIVVLNAQEFLSSSRGIHISIDLFLVGLFSGAFAVPLYIELQYQSRQENRARMVALNNMLNALAMGASSAIALVLINMLKFDLTGFLIVIALLNGIAAIVFGRKLLFETLRFLAFVCSRCLYRIKIQNWVSIPETGPALLVCNHVSYMDPIILFGTGRRPIRFLIDYRIYSIRMLTWIFRAAGAIPICSPIQNRHIYQSAIKEAISALKNGELVIIFPEGRLSRDGNIGGFKRGVEKITESEIAPTYSVAINGIWGSFFSHGGGPALKSMPRLPWYKVTLTVGSAISPAEASAEKLQEEVTHLLLKR